MSLDISSVHQNLETQIKIFGFDVQDLLLILLVSMSLNFLFGGLPFSEFIVFGIPAVISVILYFAKKGKSSNHLFETLKFHLSPGHFSAGEIVDVKKEVLK